jgi:hypothetical protein
MKNDPYPLVSVSIVNYIGRKWLEKCIPSVLATQYPNFEVVLADNASYDGSVDFVKLNYPSRALDSIGPNFQITRMKLYPTILPICLLVSANKRSKSS